MGKKFIKTISLFFCTVIVFTSCQKEIDIELDDQNGNGTGGGGTSTNNIIGDYDFVGMHATTLSTVTVTIAGEENKTITTSDYYGKNCSGTTKITSSQMIGTSIGYSIDTTMNGKTYINGALISDIDLPFQVTVPPTSSTSTYVRNGADTLTVTGTFGSAPNPSGNTPSGPTGVRYSWSGDTLILKMAMAFTQTINQGGIPATMTGKITAESRLKKRCWRR
jgi:hypothetical protein